MWLLNEHNYILKGSSEKYYEYYNNDNDEIKKTSWYQVYHPFTSTLQPIQWLYRALVNPSYHHFFYGLTMAYLTQLPNNIVGLDYTFFK